MKLEMRRTKPYLVCIDSDGCVFDTMELKHKECICPASVLHWELQGISKYVREALEFANLYSVYRGIHPFRSLVIAFRLLGERPEVKRRGVVLPDLQSLEEWIEKTPSLGVSELERYCETVPYDRTLDTALTWFKDVNERIKEMVHHIPPFPCAEEALAMLSEKTDIIVVSTAPLDQLEKEWTENGLTRYLSGMAGCDTGSKKDSIKAAISDYYDRENVIMIGDAPGDYEAAKENDVKFYPIVPEQEEESWQRFCGEACKLFFEGNYTPGYQAELLRGYFEHLPEKPCWK